LASETVEREIEMKRAGIIAALSAFFVVMLASAALAAVSPGTYLPTIDPANAPSGAHLQTGSIFCTVAADLSVTCSSYELSGVGHTNADVSLSANYTAIIDCFNPGTNPNNPIESHVGTYSPEDSDALTSSKNGRLRVPSESVSFANAPVGCPNANWTPVVREGSVQLLNFSYTLTFEGFTSPYIVISA
jgi:hypothetical protein